MTNETLSDSSALPVHPWPGPLPSSDDGVFVIAVHTAGGTLRDSARQQVRQALQDMLIQLLGMPPDGIAVRSTPGEAPCIVLRDGDTERSVGCSFAHEDGLSLVAINLHGPVGVDLMPTAPVHDWPAVASDYLGPAVTSALQALPRATQPQSFAQAWANREASLKCLGMPLSEWSGEAEPVCHTVPLQLPAGWAGTLARPLG
jgi:4'-phosphopantetheinyl transferase